MSFLLTFNITGICGITYLLITRVVKSKLEVGKSSGSAQFIVYKHVENGENFVLECVVVWLVQFGFILFTTAMALYINERIKMLYSRVTSGGPSLRVRGMQVTYQNQNVNV